MLPNHHAIELLFGQRNRLLNTIQHCAGNGVHFGFERNDANAVTVVPQTHAVVLEGGGSRRKTLTQDRVREALALIHG